MPFKNIAVFEEENGTVLHDYNIVTSITRVCLQIRSQVGWVLVFIMMWYSLFPTITIIKYEYYFNLFQPTYLSQKIEMNQV